MSVPQNNCVSTTKYICWNHKIYMSEPQNIQARTNKTNQLEPQKKLVITSKYITKINEHIGYEKNSLLSIDIFIFPAKPINIFVLFTSLQLITLLPNNSCKININIHEFNLSLY